MVYINKNNLLLFFLKSFVIVVDAATHQIKFYRYIQTYNSHLSSNKLVVEKHLTLKEMLTVSCALPAELNHVK